jgi:hypothetical protein
MQAEDAYTWIQSLTEVGFAATPRANSALALSGVCSLAASNHTSSLDGHSSQPFIISFLASARFLCHRTGQKRALSVTRGQDCRKPAM